MAKILFFTPTDRTLTIDAIENEPCGGTEKANVYLADALSQIGHECTVLGRLDSPEILKEYDVIVTQEAELFQHVQGQKCIWWSHHFSDQPVTVRSAPWVRVCKPAKIALSETQAFDLESIMKIKTNIIPYGVPTHKIKERGKIPMRLIYASTPFRGLEHLPRLFSMIKKEHPHATLVVCSSMAIYKSPEEDIKYQGILDELAKMDGVEVKGALSQNELFKEFAKAHALFYPCTFRETFCLAAEEARAHGCLIWTTPSSLSGAVSERADRIFSLDGKTDIKWQFLEPPPVLSWEDVARKWERVILI